MVEYSRIFRRIKKC